MALKKGFFIFLAALIIVARFFQFATHTSKEASDILEHGAPSTHDEDSPKRAHFTGTAVRGERATSAAGALLDTLWVQVSLGPRSSEADLSKVTIELSDGPNHRGLVYSTNGSDDGTFTASLLRDTGNTYTPASPILSHGDLLAN